MFALRYIDSIGGLEVVSGHDVVDVVDSSRPHSDFGEVGRPHSSIGIFALILGEVGWVDMIMDVSISLVPFLIVILLEVMMSWMDGEVLTHPRCQLKLFIDFIQQQIIFLANHAMAIRTVP